MDLIKKENAEKSRDSSNLRGFFLFLFFVAVSEAGERRSRDNNKVHCPPAGLSIVVKFDLGQHHMLV